MTCKISSLQLTPFGAVTSSKCFGENKKKKEFCRQLNKVPFPAGKFIITSQNGIKSIECECLYKCLTYHYLYYCVLFDLDMHMCNKHINTYLYMRAKIARQLDSPPEYCFWREIIGCSYNSNAQFSSMTSYFIKPMFRDRKKS